jgi:wyosine [tRNA(Phe)-imidazoG37] synthetase (radical SAM superfamily)
MNNIDVKKFTLSELNEMSMKEDEDKCIQCQHYNTGYCDDWCDNYVLFEPIQKPEEKEDWEKLLEEAKSLPIDYFSQLQVKTMVECYYNVLFAKKDMVEEKIRSLLEVISLMEKERIENNNKIESLTIFGDTMYKNYWQNKKENQQLKKENQELIDNLIKEIENQKYTLNLQQEYNSGFNSGIEMSLNAIERYRKKIKDGK